MRKFLLLLFVLTGIMLNNTQADVTYVKNQDGTVTKQEIVPLAEQENIIKDQIANIQAMISTLQNEVIGKQAELQKKQAELNSLLTIK